MASCSGCHRLFVGTLPDGISVFMIKEYNLFKRSQSLMCIFQYHFYTMFVHVHFSAAFNIVKSQGASQKTCPQFLHRSYGIACLGIFNSQSGQTPFSYTFSHLNSDCGGSRSSFIVLRMYQRVFTLSTSKKWAVEW